MKTTTAAGLRNRFSMVSQWIHAGETVVITKRGKPFASLLPIANTKGKPSAPVHRMARLRRIFPSGPVPGDAQDLLEQDRGET